MSQVSLILSLAAAIILAAASLLGLLNPGDSYPTAELQQAFMPNDIVNLVVGLPILLGSIWLARRGQLVGLLVAALLEQTPVAAIELALHVADGLTTPAWVIGGLLLWKKRPFGYVVALGLLFQASMLFVGLLALLIVQPLLTTASFAPVDFVVVFIFGLLFSIPFTLFVRGVISK